MGRKDKNRKGGRRKDRKRNIRKAFHIICEGQNTEPDYFNAFRLNNVSVTCFGKGEQRMKLVQSTITYIKQNQITIDKTEEVWVVFDFDIKEDERQRINQDFNAAIELAKKNEINCAVSNDAFELWYVLHFLFTDSSERRDWYFKRLTKELGKSYGKDKSVSKEMYGLLLEKQPTAIKNAKRLAKLHQGKNPCDMNPFTNVHLLVQELNKYKRS